MLFDQRPAGVGFRNLVGVERDQVERRGSAFAIECVGLQQAADDDVGVRVVAVLGDDGGHLRPGFRGGLLLQADSRDSVDVEGRHLEADFPVFSGKREWAWFVGLGGKELHPFHGEPFWNHDPCGDLFCRDGLLVLDRTARVAALAALGPVVVDEMYRQLIKEGRTAGGDANRRRGIEAAAPRRQGFLQGCGRDIRVAWIDNQRVLFADGGRGHVVGKDVEEHVLVEEFAAQLFEPIARSEVPGVYRGSGKEQQGLGMRGVVMVEIVMLVEEAVVGGDDLARLGVLHPGVEAHRSAAVGGELSDRSPDSYALVFAEGVGLVAGGAADIASLQGSLSEKTVLQPGKVRRAAEAVPEVVLVA